MLQSLPAARSQREYRIFSGNLWEAEEEDLRDMGKKYLELNYKPPEHNGTIDDNIWSSKLKCGTRGNSFLNQFPIIRIETEILITRSIINIVNT